MSTIFVLLSKEFVKWIVIANIIAWPVAYFAMNKWLQNFAYRINIGIWIFIVSALFALIIATPFAMKKKLWGLLLIPVVYLINILRIVFMYWFVRSYGLEHYNLVHGTLWSYGLIGVILILWLLWIRIFRKKKKAK